MDDKQKNDCSDVQPSLTDNPQSRTLLSTAYHSQEGKIFISGLWLLFLFGVWLFVTFLWSQQKAQYMVAMTATHILFGRAAGMSFGYAVGLDNLIVILVNIVIETILVCLFYPLFVFSMRRLVVIPFMRSFMERTRQAALANQALIKRWRIPGLLFFVWFPFWMTGPLVGCVIGFLLGMRPIIILSIVLLGTYLAIGTWSIILHGLHQRVAEFGPYAPLILLSVIVILIVGFSLYLKKRNKKRENDNIKNV
jgi:uncharacterized membrane protein